MPANLTPQYLKTEEAYRRAGSPDEELRCLETMLRELPKHKGTDKLQADLKQKISRLKKEVEEGRAAGKRTHSTRIPRQGAGRVVLLGAPNVGKSQFVAAVTRAHPEVADYPFTTREPAPAMMPCEDVMIQLIDTPPVTPDLLDPTMHGLVRGADLVVLMMDLSVDEGLQQCQDVLARFDSTKTRLARTSHLDEEDVGLSYTQTFLVLNKVDLPDAMLRWELFQADWESPYQVFPVSASIGTGLEELKKAIFQGLDIVRVYTKLPHAKEPDMQSPFTVRRGATLLDVADQIHHDVAARLRSARVWGSHVHDGTSVKPDYLLHDRDIIELHF